MNFAILTLAWLLPLLLGVAATLAVLPRPIGGVFRLGLALCLGWVLAGAIAGGGLMLFGSGRLAAVLAVIGLTLFLGCVARIRLQSESRPKRSPKVDSIETQQRGWVFWAIAGLIALRFLIVAVDGWTRPVFAVDSLGYWGLVAKSSFLEGRWQADFDNRGFVPPLIPSLQIWVAMVLQRFDDTLMHLAWSFFFASGALVAYGWVRFALPNRSHYFALAAAYLALSMPLLNVHVALGGYADLILAVLFLAAVVTTQIALTSRSGSWAILAIALCFTLPFTKKWGWVLIVLIAMGVVLDRALLGQRRISPRFAALSIGAIGVVGLVVLQRGVKVSHYELNLSRFNPNLGVYWDALGAMDNFHILTLVFFVTLCLAGTKVLSPAIRFSTFCVLGVFGLTMLAFGFDIAEYRYNAAVFNRTLMVWALLAGTVSIIWAGMSFPLPATTDIAHGGTSTLANPANPA